MRARNAAGPAATPGQAQRLHQGRREADSSVTELAAWRCWSHHACPFWCRYVDDCELNSPLPVHEPWTSPWAPTGTGG